MYDRRGTGTGVDPSMLWADETTDQELNSSHHIYVDLLDLWCIKPAAHSQNLDLIFSKQKQHLQTKLMLKTLLHKKVDPSH